MDTDSSPNQGPSSGGDEHNERPHSSVVGTVSEFNHVVAAYNVSPSIVNNAQAFTRLRPNLQLLHLYLGIQEIRSTVSTLAHPSVPLPPDLEENIKTYSKVLLAQPAIKTYDVTALLNYMMAIIKRMRWGLPAGAENTPNIWNRVAKSARKVIQGTRCDWKKHMKKGVESGTHILALAKKLTNGIPGFEIQEPFLVRVAILRYVLVSHPGENYWSWVDDQLKKIEGEEAGMRNDVLREFFMNDQTKYRRGASGVIVMDDLSSSNNLQHGCSIMTEAAEVMDQMADPSS